MSSLAPSSPPPASAPAPAARFFTDRRTVFLLATLCCLLWGSAYPAIKNGYAMLQIAANDIPSKLVFAGWRFAFAGLVLLVFAQLGGKEVLGLSRHDFGQATLLGLVQTSLQYVFFYVGLAYATGVKSSIMNATGTFFSVLLAHWLHKNDRLSFNKALGCIVGFLGVMVVNFHAGLLSFDFTWAGEGSVVLAAFILSVGTIYGKKVSQEVDSVVLTGWQLGIGGVVLLAMGFATGGHLEHWSLDAVLRWPTWWACRRWRSRCGRCCSSTTGSA